MAMNILIGDAQPRVRFGLRLLFEQQPGWNVVAEVDDAQTLLGAVCLGCPDLVLVDWDLPGIPAEELLVQIRQQCPCLGVIFMSGKIELRSIALLAGAEIFAYKADPPEKLLEQIREFIVDKHKS
jgi:DNA-binding NarL/FixJ family response regulator